MVQVYYEDNMKTTYNIQVNNDLTLKLKQYGKVENHLKGVIIICHGMAEHIERYNEFMEYLSVQNFLAIGYNQRGHKDMVESADKCGYMDDRDNFEVLVEDLELVIAHTKQSFPNMPIFIIGHSMGSFVLQRYMQLYGSSINGAILIGSNFNKGLKITFGNFISSIITSFKGRQYKSTLIDNACFGNYNKKINNPKTKFDWLSRDEENNKKYMEDEYCGIIFSASYFKDLTANFKKIRKNFDLTLNELPTYILSGDADPVGDYGKGALLLYEQYKKTGVKDITLKIYKEARHELLNEINKNEVYEDIVKWINNRVISR